MIDAVDALILDLLEWVENGERSYTDVMDAWRTSCPRLPVWEEVTDRGLIVREQADGRSMIKVTSSGRALLDLHRLSQQSHASHAA